MLLFDTGVEAGVSDVANRTDRGVVDALEFSSVFSFFTRCICSSLVRGVRSNCRFLTGGV